MTDNRVPSWVHMADVPPPTDEEPWYTAFRADRRADRDRSRLVTAACVLLLAAMVGIAFLAGRAS